MVNDLSPALFEDDAGLNYEDGENINEHFDQWQQASKYFVLVFDKDVAGFLAHYRDRMSHANVRGEPELISRDKQLGFVPLQAHLRIRHFEEQIVVHDLQHEGSREQREVHNGVHRCQVVWQDCVTLLHSIINNLIYQ